MAYVPGRGDVVWLDFDPQLGREQSGRRPALVLAVSTYNEKVGLALFCPITSKIKGYPFEVVLPDHLVVGGAVLSDQIKSLDWRRRRADFACKVPEKVVLQVQKNAQLLLF